MLFLKSYVKYDEIKPINQIILKLASEFEGLNVLIKTGLFEINHVKKIKNFLMLFVEFYIDEEEIKDLSFNNLEEISNNVLESIENTGGVRIYRFYDFAILKANKELYEKLFEVEMLIREFFTIILVEQQEQLNNIFTKNSNINPHALKGVQESIIRKNYENDLFYFEFNDYQKLRNFKKNMNFKFKELCSTSYTLEEIKTKIGEIIEKRNLFNYDEQIKKVLDFFEEINKIRLRIAHCRKIEKEDLPNEEENYSFYQRIKSIEDELNALIENVCNKVKRPVSAIIYLEPRPNQIGMWRQNSTTIEFEDGEQEEIDFGDMEYFADGQVEEIYPKVKEDLFNYLVKKLYNFDNEEIDVNFEFF